MNSYCEGLRMCLDCVAVPISILNGAMATFPVEIDAAPCQTHPAPLSPRNS